jgi:hypothetical protein
MGSVQDDDKPVAQAHVVLVPWPRNDPNVFFSLVAVAGDGAGRFNFSGLAPGGYKLFAVPAESKGRLQRPNVLDRLLSAAEEISLGANQVRNVNLKLTRP